MVKQKLLHLGEALISHVNATHRLSDAECSGILPECSDFPVQGDIVVNSTAHR
jgi:hypothetical protein